MNNRFIWEEGDLIAPGDDICCRDCKFRITAFAEGYKRGICDKYDDVYKNSKPNSILFDNQECDFYEKDGD